MNYVEITATALGYADRTDAETVAKIDVFLRLVEARVNQRLSARETHLKVNIPVVDDATEYYDLPSAFQHIKSIDVCTSAGKTTLQYIGVEQLYSRLMAKQLGNFYAVTNDKIQLYYDFVGDGSETVEIVYVSKLQALTSVDTENWLSQRNPDVYINGLLVEINAFVKDAEAATLYEQRFKDSLAAITEGDWENYWNGTSMQTRVG